MLKKLSPIETLLLGRRPVAVVLLIVTVGGSAGLALYALNSIAIRTVGCGPTASCQITEAMFFERGYNRTSYGFDFLVISYVAQTSEIRGLSVNGTRAEFTISPGSLGSYCDALTSTVKLNDRCLVAVSYHHPINGTLILSLTLSDGGTFGGQVSPFRSGTTDLPVLNSTK